MYMYIHEYGLRVHSTMRPEDCCSWPRELWFSSVLKICVHVYSMHNYITCMCVIVCVRGNGVVMRGYPEEDDEVHYEEKSHRHKLRCVLNISCLLRERGGGERGGERERGGGRGGGRDRGRERGRERERGGGERGRREGEGGGGGRGEGGWEREREGEREGGKEEGGREKGRKGGERGEGRVRDEGMGRS